MPDKKEEFVRIFKSFYPSSLVAFYKKVVLLTVILGAFLIFILTCVVYVKPNEFAIKQVNIGVNSGIRKTVYNTGFHVIAPFGVHLMHKFPKDTQVFELTNFPETKAKGVRFKKAVHIQTSDGFFVDVDVSILYHIEDPYKLITTVGPGKFYEDIGVIPKVEPKLKESLGEMTTEEFYNSSLRVLRAEQARVLLAQELEPKGIKIEHVLVRYFKYSDEIQRNIEEKKLKDQMVFTNQSKAKAAGEEALVKKVKEEGEAKIKIKLEEGHAYVVKRIAEKDLYVRTKHAEGDLLVKLAEAKRTELVNNAYQREGSDKLIGLKMAEVLKGINVIILPSSGVTGFNPLDLNKDIELFGINDKGGK